MRKPKTVLLFAYGIETLDLAFSSDLDLVYFPIDHVLADKDIAGRNSLVLIWDAGKHNSGHAKIREIRKAFPRLPVLVVAQNPSREYLLAAIKAKVTNLFTFPLKDRELQDAIDQAFKNEFLPSFMDGIRSWIGKLTNFNLPGTKPAALSQTSPGSAPSETQLVLDMAPGFSFPDKTLEPENDYDMNVEFFGNLNINLWGKALPDVNGKKNNTLLAYLLFHHGHAIHKDVLMDKFWSDVSLSSAKNSLNVAICNIRKSMSGVFKNQEIILYGDENYSVNPELKILTDTEKFTHLWKKGRETESSSGLPKALNDYNRAIKLYKDEFLVNIRQEEWCEFERDNLREIYLFILNRLSVFLFDKGNYNGCINICRKMLAKDNCLEEIHRKLMSCYYLTGLIDMALKQYYKCEKALKKEFDLNPSDPTMELYNRIKHGKPLRA